MEQWQKVNQWDDTDAFDGWLRLEGLTNSEAIIDKVINEGEIIYAKGTYRLRYKGGKFYQDKYIEDRTDYGIGSQIDLKALEKRFKGLYPKAHITVRFNKHPNAVACAILETDKDGTHTFKIQLNPAKLSELKQVAEKVRHIEKQLAG